MATRRILFICYWGFDEGLTQSTVLPHIKILSELPEVEYVALVTIERSSTKATPRNVVGAKHIRYYSKARWAGKLIGAAIDFLYLPIWLNLQCKKHGINALLCRTSLAGSLGLAVNSLNGIPFAVESFEPHADYMLAAGIWRKNGLRYKLQRTLENQQVHRACALITVSKHYMTQLRNQRDKGLYNFPCAVDQEKFKFDPVKRESLREQLNMVGSIVGIYVGKFGDIYLEEEAFDLFKAGFDFFGPEFRLVLLTPTDSEVVVSHLRRVQINPTKVLVTLVPHADVSSYLSLADFAYSLHKPSGVSRYFSPIKNGEYWASGLPVLAPEGVGEDSEIISENDAGAVFDGASRSLDKAYQRISSLLDRDRLGGEIRNVALRHRNFEHLGPIYSKVLKSPQMNPKP